MSPHGIVADQTVVPLPLDVQGEEVNHDWVIGVQNQEISDIVHNLASFLLGVHLGETPKDHF